MPGRGDTLERIARQHYGDDWRAGLTLLMADNGLGVNRWGSPVIRAGDTLNVPSLQGLNAQQLGQLAQMGGQVLANNSQGLNARAQLEAMRAQQAAAQAAARQASPPGGMSQDEAYARYMASGGRSGSYARALGEDYKPTWHAGARPEPATITRWEQGRPVATISPLPDDPVTQFFTGNPVGRFWRGASDAALNLVPNALGSVAGLVGDGWGYLDRALNPRPDSVLSSQPAPYYPSSPLLQHWEQHGFAGAAGTLITDTVRGLPGINLVDELGRPSRNWEAVGGAAAGAVGRPLGFGSAAPSRVFNGVSMHPGVPAPAAGWGYAPAAIHSASAARANAHLNGYVGEIHQVNRIAATMPNEAIVMWGNRVTQNGNDIITVNRITGEVTLWDNKFRSYTRSIGGSGTFTPGSNSFANARNQAIEAIRNSDLPAKVQAQALRKLDEGNIRTITSGSGNARNSVFTQHPVK